MKAAATMLIVAGFLVFTMASKSSYSNSELNSETKPWQFKPGNEYIFEYNGQIATGLNEPAQPPAQPNDDNKNDSENPQNVMTRSQAKVKIQFIDEQRARLQISQLRLAQMNGKTASDPKSMQPLAMFQAQPMDDEKRSYVEMPTEFSYVNGLVKGIHFASDEPVWSKNVKRAILNLMQVNLERKQQSQQEPSQRWNSYEQSDEQKQKGQFQFGKTFVVPETTIEGNCLTVYTINNVQPRSEWEQRRGFNVTKSINFKQCGAIADVAFGFQGQDEQKSQCARMGCNTNVQNGDNTFPTVDNESCDPKEVNEENIYRSTVHRIECAGDASEKKCAIKRSEILSQYVFKSFNAQTDLRTPSAMQTVAILQLEYRGMRQGESKMNNDLRHGSTNEEYLMYDNEDEADLKRFYMLGDKSHVQMKNNFDKVKEASNIYRKVIEATIEKGNGVEGMENTEIPRLISILRICTVNELQSIQKVVDEQWNKGGDKRVEQLIADTLAAAGTRNTVHVLMKKINDGKISPARASRSINNLQAMPAPSFEIISELENLFRQEITNRSPLLRQSSLLTYGALVGKACRNKISLKTLQQELQQQQPTQQQQQHWKRLEKNGVGELLAQFGTQTGFNNQRNQKKQNEQEELACSPKKKKAYKKMLLEQYERASSSYEKILALKAIGNAGLDNMFVELENVIVGRRGESTIVRTMAVDSLRRLRKQMPRKIQRILLPVFQNAKMPTEVRAASFNMLMSAEPESHITDQVLYAVSKERSSQIKSLVYTLTRSYIDSPIPEQRKTAKHLKSALKISGMDEEQLKKGSKYVQFPFYSREQKDGLQLTLTSVFQDNQALPVHLAAGLNTIFNGKLNDNLLKVSLSQENMTQVLQQVIELLYGQMGQDKDNDYKTRAGRNSAMDAQNADNQHRGLFSELKIKSRRNNKKQWKGDNNNSQRNNNSNKNAEPLAVLNLRFANVDQGILPLTAQDVIKAISVNANNNWQSPATIGGALLREWVSAFGSNSVVRSLSLTVFNDKMAIIPTTAGIPIRIAHSTSVLTCIDIQSKNVNDPQVTNIDMKGHALITGVHAQKMEYTSQLTAGGVDSSRVMEMNAPLNSQIQVESTSQQQSNSDNGKRLKFTWTVPQQKTRLFGVHTLALTYTRNGDEEGMQGRNMHSLAYQPRFSDTLEMNKVVGERSMCVPLRVSGHFQMPNRLNDLSAWLQLMMTSENHMHVFIEPKPQTPRSITWQAQSALFQPTNPTRLAEALQKLNNFYDNFEEDFRAPSSQNNEKSRREIEQNRQKLSQTIGRLSQQNNKKGENAVYKHSVKLSMQSHGGQSNTYGHFNMDAVCDSRFKACDISSKIERSPFYAQESGQWSARANAQFILPSTMSSWSEWKRYNSQKQNKLVAKAECTWGTDNQQFINLRIHGEKAQWNNENWNQNEEEQYSSNNSKLTAFLNKFEVVSDYKLELAAQNALSQIFDAILVYNFWNTDTESLSSNSGRDGQVYASLLIEPTKARLVNLQARTPTQAVRINAIQMPVQMRPVSLIRNEQSMHSVAQMLSRFNRNNMQAKCMVTGYTINTFDGARFKGPITSSCYSVLAKDCSNEQTPQFAVLMKSLNSDGQHKKIKMIVPGQKIECQANDSSDNSNNGKIACTINDKPVRGMNSRMPSYNSASSSEEGSSKRQQIEPIVEYNNDDKTAVTINAPSGAVSLVFACNCKDCKCQKLFIQLANEYKNAQCGLCGHYDDNRANEWRMANGESAENAMDFHRSYSVIGKIDEDKENVCTQNDQNNFYSTNKQKFEFETPVENMNVSGKWNNDENYYDSYNNYGSDSHSNEDYGSRRSQHIEPVMKTKMMENHHQICFSSQPIKQCPRGSVPTSNTGNNDNNKNKKKKNMRQEYSNEDYPWSTPKDEQNTQVKYVCVQRDEARHIKRAVQSNNEKRVAELLKRRKASFMSKEHEPKNCRRV